MDVRVNAEEAPQTAGKPRGIAQALVDRVVQAGRMFFRHINENRKAQQRLQLVLDIARWERLLQSREANVAERQAWDQRWRKAHAALNKFEEQN